MISHFLRRHIAEIELQAARQHRDRHLLRICRRKNEFDVLGRLLQRLQHGIEGRAGKLMHFVDHVDLEAGVRRRVHGLLKQCRHLIHASVARRVHFDVIDEMAFIYCAAGFTDAAWLIGDITLAVRACAVEAFRKDAGERGLANTAGSGEKVSVMNPLFTQRMSQGFDDVLLAHHAVKVVRSPFSSKNLIGH